MWQTYIYHADEVLGQDENCGSSSSEMEETDVDKLAAKIEDEVARKEGSVRTVQILHPVSV